MLNHCETCNSKAKAEDTHDWHLVNDMNLQDRIMVEMQVNANPVLCLFPVSLLKGLQKDIIPSNFASQLN